MNPSEVLALVARFHRENTRRLHLVPSENVMSLATRLPFLTDAVHRYCFPVEGGNPHWPGRDGLVEVERAAVTGLRELFGADHVNLKAISGLNCMGLAISALTERGTTLFGIAEQDGGHGATRFLAERLGVPWRPLPFDRAAYGVDAERLADTVAELRGPACVYLDQFMCLFPHDLKAIRAAVGPHVPIHYDGSHVMGLIAGGQFQDPLREGADSLGGSTHKTLPGPHKGVLLTDSEQLARKFDQHSGYWVSHHHPADVAALAIAVAELRQDGRAYAERTVRNARHLGRALADRGLEVCGAEHGFTASHQLWMDTAPVIDPLEAGSRLLAAGIVVNAIPIPYVQAGNGLRLGVQEVSRLGMGTEEMDQLADCFARLLVRRQAPERVAPEVFDLVDRFARHEEEQWIENLLRSVQRRVDR